MTRTRLRIVPPPDFSFASTVRSHGWCTLPPFSTDRSTSVLHLALLAADRLPVRCTLSGGGDALDAVVESARPLGAGEKRAVAAGLRSCLRMDEDFTGFTRLVRRHPEHRWIAARRAGRMLRAPTAFEDAVKMICTTNCSWALTTSMVTALVRLYGTPLPGGGMAFPDPAALASAGERALRRDARLGYRAPYIAAFAARVAAGGTDPERWRRWDGDTASLFREMQLVKGIGPYAAGNLLKLAGRYEHLGLDSWVRKKYADLRHGGRRVSDRAIERAYAPYGAWRGLVFWLEMTKEWYTEKFHLPEGG